MSFAGLLFVNGNGKIKKMKPITGSKLYDYIQCPHKVWRDAWGPQDEKIKEANPFVEMLWERGVQHEERVIKNIGEHLDLKEGNLNERFQKTIAAMKNKTPLIYQGVLKHENMLGIPDLIKLQPDGSYLPVEIKSGMGVEGADEDEEEGKPKKHYAVQLALYVELLEKLGFEHANRGQIIDIHFNQVDYDLNKQVGKIDKRTLWDFYKQVKNNVEVLLKNEAQNKPASSGKCKLCPWCKSCKKWVIESEDLSGLFYVGASKRDIINEDLGIEKISGILGLDIEEVMHAKKKDKNFLKGVGEGTLDKIKKRAEVLLKIKKPVLYGKLELPKVNYELFFDIEDDPTQEFVYLHGVYERSSAGERFLDFTAKEISAEAEKEAWRNFWEYIRSLPKDDFAVYYFSQHEKTTYKRMQRQYPDVISAEELEEFFSNPNVIDLYGVALKQTDWPLPSYSIKELAVYLGFKWRDETPSGALSIQWFNNYINNRDEKILKRILEYNEDDCRATMVLKDALERMSHNALVSPKLSGGG